MCGINGFTFKDETLLREMNRVIRHRGPDGEGEFYDENVSFGHLRLAIVDVHESGHQPMYYGKRGASSLRYLTADDLERDYIIVFNGEIYNYLEIREELIKLGYSFTTQSDTEVILAAYVAWGKSCVAHFNGMWALVIYDKKKKELFLSRDRLGVKPFFYFLDKKGELYFSSELKGLLVHKTIRDHAKKSISKQAIELYFSLGYIPSPYTIYEDVYKLPQGSNATYDLVAKKLAVERYYTPPVYDPTHDKSKLVEEGQKLLEDAVRLRLRSDVPVGAFLSGGLDSSSVVAEMVKQSSNSIHTFSIGFEGKYDESSFIRAVNDAVPTTHHHRYFAEEDVKEILPFFGEMYDEPFWDYSGFPTYVVSGEARKQVTVVLSGDGGDEIFGGYTTHVLGHVMDTLHKIPKSLRLLISRLPLSGEPSNLFSLRGLKKACQVSLSPKSQFLALATNGRGYKPESYKKWTTERLAECLVLAKNNLSEALRLYDLLYNSLPDNFLVKVDRASMRHPVEVRSPFLDYRFVEFSQKIPTAYKVNFSTTKILMRLIITPLLPKIIVTRGKQGFSPPLAEWILKDSYRQDLDKAHFWLKKLHPDIAAWFETSVFNQETDVSRNYRIRLLLFGVWYKTWIEST